MNDVAQENQQQGERINVRVLFFGAAHDAVGQREVQLTLSGPATAATAFEQLITIYPDLRRFGRSLLFAVNQEYAAKDLQVREGDELALFPPVSGGSDQDCKTRKLPNTNTHRQEDTGIAKIPDAASRAAAHDFFELTTEPISVGRVARRIVLPECGATVTLDGYAREWTNGKRTLYLIYEAYPPMALSEMERLGSEAHERFDIAHMGIVHRTGKLQIGDTSVVIAVSAPHRGAAFAACEWAIRELKRTVPIWKKEVFENGEVWVEGEALVNP